MVSSEKEKISDEEKIILENQNDAENNVGEEIISLSFSNATDSLMPELEELVKKNPNRLIGCGG